jgi:hypothetical protein
LYSSPAEKDKERMGERAEDGRERKKEKGEREKEIGESEKK